MTTYEVAVLAGVTAKTIWNWMVELDVERRSRSASRVGRRSGTASPRWGRTHPAEVRAKISLHHADVSGGKNPMFGRRGELAPKFGRPTVQSTRDKISAALRGTPRPWMVGEKNPEWKGGKTSLAARIRSSRQAVEWRDAIYQRDGYRCQDCGDARGGNLNAHHLMHLSQILDEEGVTTLEQAFACNRLWDITNGTTLCEPCHDQRHAT
jgi:NUMOD3 motif